MRPTADEIRRAMRNRGGLEEASDAGLRRIWDALSEKDRAEALARGPAGKGPDGGPARRSAEAPRKDGDE